MLNHIWKAASDTPSTINEVYSFLLRRRGLSKNTVKDNVGVKEILQNPKDINISKKQITLLSDIVKKILDQEKGIVIHGDYDVDGITSTAIMYECLLELGFAKDKIGTFVPSRFKHGYGFSGKSFDYIKSTYNSKDYPLIVLVDCGITAIEQVKKAKKLGYKVVIIDHHQKSGKIPNANVVFWNQDLTASALSYFVSKYLQISILKQTNINSSLDLASLGYVCDLGDLSSTVGHILTKEGLKSINKDTRPGIKALLKSDKAVRSYDLGWVIGPKLNAAGRIEDPNTSLKVLLGEDVVLNAESLFQLNTDRQDTTKSMYDQALSGLSNGKFVGLDESHKIAVVHSEDFHEGVIGLIASKTSKSLYKPSICISWDGEIGKGSCRSIEGVNIVALLDEVSAFLENYGGHPMAAGFSIKKQDYANFESALLDVASTNIDSSLLVPKVVYDFDIKPDFLTSQLLDFIDNMEPFGNKNPKPSFVLKSVKLDNFRLMGKDGDHLSFVVNDLDARAVFFGGGKILPRLTNIQDYDVLFEFEKNEWKGSVYPQLLVKDIKPSEF